MKILTYIFFTAILLGIVYIFSLFQELSYFSLSNDHVEIGTLLLRPLDYRNSRVCVAGKHTVGPNMSELVDAKDPSGVIWVDNASVEKSIFSTVWQKYISNDTYKTSVARVCGTFEITEEGRRGFGPNHQHQYQITK